MSATLYMIPVKPKKGTSLSVGLKWALQKSERWNSNTESATYDMNDIPFFEGLQCAGIEDSDKVIEAIEKYGCIELYLRG